VSDPSPSSTAELRRQLAELQAENRRLHDLLRRDVPDRIAPVESWRAGLFPQPDPRHEAGSSPVDQQSTRQAKVALFRSLFADRPEVTIRVHPADNHLFFRGAGRSAPAEYEPAQHVDPRVVADIASWLTTIIDRTARSDQP